MKDYIMAVGSADVGLTPPMPFIGKRFDGSKFTVLSRLWLEVALVRCGFDVLDKKAMLSDALSDFVLQANRAGADCIVVTSYSAFGSGKSFNDFCGATVKYPYGRQSKKSRTVAEDVCAKINGIKKCTTAQSDIALNGAACPAVVIDGGYLTEFDEAKAVYDPDYAHTFAEHAAMGICEYFGMPYLPPSPETVLPDLVHASTGKRGKKIKLLQAALCAVGYQTDVDGVYGKNTELAVKEFALNNELKCDCVNEELLDCLLFNRCKSMPMGAKSVGVLYMQRKLISKLYPCSDSGILDEQTSTALAEFLSETDNDIPLLKDGGAPKSAIKLLSPIGGGRPRLF